MSRRPYVRSNSRSNVRFPTRKMSTSPSKRSTAETPPTVATPPSETLDEILSSPSSSSSSASFIPSPPADESYYPFNPSNPYIPPPSPQPAPPPAMATAIPDLFTTFPVLRDTLETKTSRDQDATARSCIDSLRDDDDPLPILDREDHEKFLESGLLGGNNGKLPGYMVALDASRPWIVYWCLQGLWTLGVDVRKYRRRVVDSLRPMQNVGGGFGGGNGQFSHLTSSYAAVLSLAMLGGGGGGGEGEVDDDEEPEEPLEIVDRRAMYKWLHEVKDWESGGFRVSVGGEEDVRGVYCALVMLALLGLPTSGDLLKGTKEYLGRCQTYEGGFGATPNGNEAHGGYAFCTLASLCILGEPREMLNKYLDMGRLISWMSARQYAPEGGLSGRTNKLVDGCYSTWVGGCWALIEAGLNGPQSEDAEARIEVVGSLWSREGLARYIMTYCQSPRGGLRDKPGKGPDFYHTNYILLGLASLQTYYYYVPSTTPPPPADNNDDANLPLTLPLTAPFLWRYIPIIPSKIPGTAEVIIPDLPTWPDDAIDDAEATGGEEEATVIGDRLRVHHPIFNIPFDRVAEVEKWARERVGF